MAEHSRELLEYLAAQLSEEERRIVELAAQGNTYEEIADAMCMSRRTVARIIRRIKDHLDAPNIIAATVCLIDIGEIDPFASM